MKNRFVVDLGEMKISDTDKRRIANAIQSAVLGELARLDSATAAEPWAVFDPVRLRNPLWYGIWIDLLRDRAGLPQLEKGIKEIQTFAGQ